MSRQPQILGALITTSLLIAIAAQGGEIYREFPNSLDPQEKYVIYLHGKIIEDQGPRPIHEKWGIYDYQQILDKLATADLNVISEQRRPDTDMDQFAQQVARQVRILLSAKISAEHITVIGFSKGGGIAIRTSALLKNDKVNFVFLGACGDGDFSGTNLNIQGRILSIYEASDEIGQSCSQLFAKSTAPGERVEIKITTGGGHGAFFRPRKEWLAPILSWIHKPQ